MELIDLDPNDDEIFDQSETEKLYHTNSLTDKQRINIISCPALRAAPAKIAGLHDVIFKAIKNVRKDRKMQVNYNGGHSKIRTSQEGALNHISIIKFDKKFGFTTDPQPKFSNWKDAPALVGSKLSKMLANC